MVKVGVLIAPYYIRVGEKWKLKFNEKSNRTAKNGVGMKVEAVKECLCIHVLWGLDYLKICKNQEERKCNVYRWK